MFELIKRSTSGCKLIAPRVFRDDRGEFVKPYNWNGLQAVGVRLTVKEEIFSVSRKNVLRGLHFQIPPYDHQKLIYCVKGKILDVVVDIRANSPHFGEVFSAELSSENRRLLLVPRGFAHGFLSLEDYSTVVYKTDTVYAPDHDQGIRWDSIDFEWPLKHPLLSERDSITPALKDFVSPFDDTYPDD